MKRWWLILFALVAGVLIGRLTVQPKVVTQTVVEYRTINTSALAPIKVSEPIGARTERVKMLRKNIVLNISRVEKDSTEMDTTKKVVGLSNGLSNQTVTDSNTFFTAELPIRDYTFSDDSTYTITARGVYVESLPKIEFRPRMTTTTRTETVVRTPRISHGLQLGVGAALTPKGLQPAMYFGYGFTIKF